MLKNYSPISSHMLPLTLLMLELLGNSSLWSTSKRRVYNICLTFFILFLGTNKIDHPQIREFYENFTQVDQRLNMCKKFDEVLLAFQDVLVRFDIKTLLTNPFDDFGEILHGSVLDKFKAECVEMMNIVKLVYIYFREYNSNFSIGRHSSSKEGRALESLFVFAC